MPLDRVHPFRDPAEDGAAYPEPVPMSSTVSPPSRSSASIIRATMYGCEIVWSASMGSGESS
jgi:hypothetical protein